MTPIKSLLTNEQVTQIKRYHETYTPSEISNILELDTDFIKREMDKLGIKRLRDNNGSSNKPFTKQEVEFMAANDGLLSVGQFAKHLKCRKERLYVYFEANGLSFAENKVSHVTDSDLQFIRNNYDMKTQKLLEELQKVNPKLSYGNVNEAKKRIQREMEAMKKDTFHVDFYIHGCPVTGHKYPYPSHVQFLQA